MTTTNDLMLRLERNLENTEATLAELALAGGVDHDAVKVSQSRLEELATWTKRIQRMRPASAKVDAPDDPASRS